MLRFMGSQSRTRLSDRAATKLSQRLLKYCPCAIVSAPLSKISCLYMCGRISGSLFYWINFFFLPTHTVFFQLCELSNFVLCSITLAILDPLFPCGLLNQLVNICNIAFWDYSWVCIESVDQIGKKWHNNLESFNPWTWNISPFI